MTWLRCFFFFQAEDGIRDGRVTGVKTCALPIWAAGSPPAYRISRLWGTRRAGPPAARRDRRARRRSRPGRQGRSRRSPPCRRAMIRFAVRRRRTYLASVLPWGTSILVRRVARCAYGDEAPAALALAALRRRLRPARTLRRLGVPRPQRPRLATSRGRADHAAAHTLHRGRDVPAR